MVFFVGLFLLLELVDGPSWIGARWVYAAWTAAAAACMAMSAVAMRQSSATPGRPWRSGLRVALLLVVGPGILAFGHLHGWVRAGGEPSVSETQAFLAEQTGTGAIDDWDEDALSWAAVVEAMPPGPERDERVQALGRSLAALLAEGAFVPHETLAAAADVGALQGEVARALLTTPRGREAGPPREADVAARAWLANCRYVALTDPHEYASAVAVHDVLPRATVLNSAVFAALQSTEQALPGRAALANLAHLVRLADRAGVSVDVPAFRERVRATLLLMHRDGLDMSWALPMGFVSSSEGP
ncbi:MAG TPA: hypothetical protein VK824_02795, partial [Planctomycetota bacterium]|nr:hypothetical protein [Planctomycetota bacterium]